MPTIDPNAEHKLYLVTYKLTDGQHRTTWCTVIEGYTTEEDIPKMVRIKYGQDAWVIDSTRVYM